jgi:aspartokinase/homoserine dehydrogenase 1
MRCISVFVLGCGTVGAPLHQLLAERAEACLHHGIELRWVGVANSTRLRFEAAGLDAQTPWRVGRLTDADLDALAALPGPVLVDCTGADDLGALYHAALTRGIDVVTANKAVVAGPATIRRACEIAAARSGARLAFETTVGAALPILSTLDGLLKTGDGLVRIEGALSGSLGFICAELQAGQPLHTAVQIAAARGYLEPQPQRDLSGQDVARKAVILARALGLDVEVDAVPVEPLVPAELLAITDPEDFVDALERRADDVTAHLAAVSRPGHVLRYLACIEPGAPVPVRVGPVALPSDHPAAQLHGPQALVAFTTERAPVPLVVQGAGAGGAVTAAGVLADILGLARDRPAATRDRMRLAS